MFEPNLGIDFRRVKSLYDIKDLDMLFKKVYFVLEHVDKDRFIAFRSGKLSLPQCISRIESESKNGLRYKVLDDLKHDLDPEALKKPALAIRLAYEETVIEDRLMRDAKKRGIDPDVLKKTARNLNLLGRCAKSVYARPSTTQGLDPEMKQKFKLK